VSALSEHPTVKRYYQLNDASLGPQIENEESNPRKLDAGWLRQLALSAGADEVGFVNIDRPELGVERDDILRFFPKTRALISFVLRMNREPIRNPARSVASIQVTADSRTWLGFLAKERNLVCALIRRKIRIKGSPKLLLAFGKCFP